MNILTHATIVGRGPDGQMGHELKNELKEPNLIKKLANEQIIDIACGLDFSLALNERGDLFAWGQNTEAQLGFQSKMDKPTASSLSSLLTSSSISIPANNNNNQNASTDTDVP